MNDDSEFDPAQLQMLREKVKALPTEIAPNAAAWASIRDRIESSRVRTLPVSPELHSPARADDVIANTHVARAEWWRSPRTVTLIAASLFAAVTTAVVLRENGEQPIVTTASGNNGVVTPTPPVSVPVAPANVASVPSSTLAATPNSIDQPTAAVLAEFSAAALDLTKDLNARRARIQPSALAVVDSCLFTIDQAIKESRAALVEAPKNATILELLQVTYQQKLDLLRRAAELPTVSIQE